ncbi:MAG: cytidine deaminase [Sphaerochaetaceae bacterium]|jgi:homotetrameric cytidine deaminase
MVDALLFDMDGVLIDSEDYLAQAAVAFFESRKVKVKEEDFLPYVGAGENKYIGEVAKKYHLEIDIEEAKLETYALYKECIGDKEKPLSGVIQILESAQKANIPMAVVTSADRAKMEISLEAIGLDHSLFDVIISGEDVVKKKPHPDIYLLAAQALGVEPSKCVVFEDAPHGVSSAKAAQMSCIALTTGFSEQELLTHGADAIIHTLADIEAFTSKQEFEHILLRLFAKEVAKQVHSFAYAPYSHFQVGSAIVSKKTKKIYKGVNVENSSYGATICAERSALLSGVSSEKEFVIEMVVVISDDDPPAVPCALCLQVLSEFSDDDTVVYLYNLKDTMVKYRFSELLPHPFTFVR